MNDVTPNIGHNSQAVGPYIPENLSKKLEDFTDAAGSWLDVKKIESVEQAEKCTDFITGAKDLQKQFDAERKAQKKPHDDAAKAVQELFRKPLDTLKTAIDRVSELQTEFAMEQKRIAEERQRAEREAALKAQQEADRLAREAEARNDVSGIAEAESLKKEAEKAEKAAAKAATARIGSATGAGRTMSVRTSYHCKVEHLGPALAYYRNNPEVIALIERLATAEVRAQKGEKVAPNGFTLLKKETVV